MLYYVDASNEGTAVAAPIATYIDQDEDKRPAPHWCPDDILRAVFALLDFTRCAVYDNVELVCKRWRALLCTAAVIDTAHPQCYGLDIIRARPDEFDWDRLSTFRLCESFMREFMYRLDWPLLIDQCVLSSELAIDLVAAKLATWQGLFISDSMFCDGDGDPDPHLPREALAVATMLTNLSVAFMDRNADKLDWDLVVKHQRRLDAVLALKHIDRINLRLLVFVRNCEHLALGLRPAVEFGRTDTAVLIYYLATTMERYGPGVIRWDIISHHCMLTPELMITYADYLDWHIMSRYQSINPSIIYAYRHRVCLRRIYKHRDFGAELMAMLTFTPAYDEYLPS